jgi:NTP pyrophosphatase (non-canonical NTP hydrolase)
MKDRFEEIYNRQKYLQDKFTGVDNYPGDMSDKEKEATFIHTILLLIKEATEVLDETNFKVHVSKTKKIDKDVLLEELIDVYKYWMNLCIIYGFSANDIFEMFNKKSAIVETKLLGDSNEYRQSEDFEERHNKEARCSSG